MVRNEMELELWVILLAIAGGICLLLCSVTCCVLRCFRPENTRGPEWFHGNEGEQRTVKSAFTNDQDPDSNPARWLRVQK